MAQAPSAAPAGKPQKSTHAVTSRDGTRIAYDRWGRGPAVVLVGGALSDRAGAAELAQLLAKDFTVYAYDRRGRGGSGDNAPYAVQREVEDIEAVIDAAGGSAHVYGKSSGAALALHAAAALGGKVSKLALYEAPYDETDGAATAWRGFTKDIDDLLRAGRRAEAITAFMGFVGAPPQVVAKMKTSPAWPGMLVMAPTLAYDNRLLGDDRAVPVTLAARIKSPTLVMDGSASAGPMPFMRPTADKIAKVIPGAQRKTLEGQAHDASAQALAPVLIDFFRSGG
ncbi:MAG: alpha/beta hydrolase [Rubrivivax sp.]|nr:MAG: alpha/beta hydrolase [Rubrivivax sp.]